MPNPTVNVELTRGERRFTALNMAELNGLASYLYTANDGSIARELYPEVEAERLLRYGSGEHVPQPQAREATPAHQVRQRLFSWLRKHGQTANPHNDDECNGFDMALDEVRRAFDALAEAQQLRDQALPVEEGDDG